MARAEIETALEAMASAVMAKAEMAKAEMAVAEVAKPEMARAEMFGASPKVMLKVKKAKKEQVKLKEKVMLTVILQ